MKRIILVRITLFVCIVGQCNIALADKYPQPSSSASFSPDGKVVYVNRLKGEKDTIYHLNGKGIQKDNFSIKNYPKNGLYEVRTRKLLWQLEKKEQSFRRAVPFDDRQYMVVDGPRPSRLDDIAFEIYRDGRLIKSFLIKEFCATESTFSFSESSFMWMNNYHVDSLKKEITFVACNKNFKVDVKTGKSSSTTSADFRKMLE